VFVFHLLQIQSFYLVFVKGLTDLVHGKGLGGLELQQGAAGKINPHIGLAPGNLDGGDEADGHQHR